MHSLPSRPSARLLVVLAAGCLCVSLQAQTTSTNSDDEEAIVLSPFEVSSGQDVGYRAQNTLAGSRLNTSLKDTGAAISVLTSEFLQDLGATSMKDVILFSNNSVPDFGDSAPNFNANPMIGRDEWQLRIRGLPASYARNFFNWEVSSDFYNVERIDQSRGPNSVLFGFGAAGGIVNTSTKQASLLKNSGSLSVVAGSWGRLRGAIDANQIVADERFAVRVNAMAEQGESWREHEDYDARRLHLATRWQFDETATLKAEFETGRVRDNVARPWLAIDQAWAWREAGRPTYDAPQWDWPVSDAIRQTWSEHIVFVENSGTITNWQNMPFSYLANQSWVHLAMTPENLAIVPTRANPGGPGAERETDYTTYTVSFEKQVSDALSFELAYNHQGNDFLGYDPNAGNLTRYGYLGDATNLWGDASSVLPGGGANPYAGRLYLENNWTRRIQDLDLDVVRATAAYEFDLGRAGRHRLAGMYERSWRDFSRVEESEVFVGSPFDAAAEFDSNRVFRRYYFEEGNARDIRVPTWRTPLVDVTDPVSGRTLTAGWAPNQLINNSKQTQDTILGALQSFFLEERLVTTFGVRRDRLDYRTLPTVRNAVTGRLELDPTDRFERSFSANTLSAGAVYHLTPQLSLFGNLSSSRNLPNVNQRIIGLGIPPMPEGEGTDVGIKLDLFGGRLYATLDYYTTDLSNTSEWGNINASVTSLNNRILARMRADGLVTAAEEQANLLDANGYLESRESSGWELEVVANPTESWRLSANFSINKVVKQGIMSEVAAWSDQATSFWLERAASMGGAGYLLGGGDWDTLGNNIGWMTDYISQEVAFNGRRARGERDFGASLYTNYRIRSGGLAGLSFGGGARYQSANVIGTAGDELVRGRDLFLVDASLGYSFRTPIVGRERTIDLQLNVSNLFDSDRWQIYTVTWWDALRPERIGLQEPRKFTFTARIDF
jgi:outer membrane receptor protein involved in Fe transport